MNSLSSLVQEIFLSPLFIFPMAAHGPIKPLFPQALVDFRGALPISRKLAADVVTRTLHPIDFPLAGCIGAALE